VLQGVLDERRASTVKGFTQWYTQIQWYTQHIKQLTDDLPICELYELTVYLSVYAIRNSTEELMSKGYTCPWALGKYNMSFCPST
jgi:hypothetical protein